MSYSQSNSKYGLAYSDSVLSSQITAGRDDPKYPIVPSRDDPKFPFTPSEDPNARFPYTSMEYANPKGPHNGKEYQEDMHGGLQVGNPSDDGSKRIGGLRRRVFWTLIVVVVVVIAAVGGGVGGSLARKSKSQSSSKTSTSVSSTAPVDASTSITSSASTSTTAQATNSPAPAPSSTTSTPPALAPTSTSIPTSGLLALDCPMLNGTYYTTPAAGSEKFQILCDLDYTATDLQQVPAVTLDECIDSCANYNTNGGSCAGITFNRNATLIHSLNLGGNCFLKGDISGTSMDTQNSNVQASAMLVK